MAKRRVRKPGLKKTPKFDELMERYKMLRAYAAAIRKAHNDKT